ncbi:hypothetical protein AB0M97_05575 [Streptomyces sp. NPDC051207]
MGALGWLLLPLLVGIGSSVWACRAGRHAANMPGVPAWRGGSPHGL